MKNSAAMSTHHEQAKKLRKLRTRQRVVSLIGIAILVWGLSGYFLVSGL